MRPARLPPERLRAMVFAWLLLTSPAWPIAAARTAPARPSVPSADAVPVDAATAIRLDGDLNDDAWQGAPAIGAFVQREPREGAPATFRTEVRVLYDDAALYVGVRAFDTDPSHIIGKLTRRDESSPSDWIRIYLDSYHDRRSAFEFAVNPAGVKQDTYWFNDTSDDEGWDAVWDVAVARDDRGWEAEFRIPFSQLRFDPRTATDFGFAVVREVARLKETSSWPLLARSASGFVSSFGRLQGLHFGAALRRVELAPYVVSDVQTRPPEAGNPFVDSPHAGAAAGLDLKYKITPALTLTGTVNPDFGQVEADPAVVNLSAFETFFPERRPFFLEGSGIFRFDVDCEDDECSGLFYSRRIGRSPQIEPDLADGAFSSLPTQTTIVGASKLTGRIGGFNVGLLNAVTSEERGRVSDAAGHEIARMRVEPATSYSVVRARREFANQSSLGFMATSTNRRDAGSLQDPLASNAFTGGVDADWRLSPRYSLTGFWAGSDVRGTSGAIEALQESTRHLFQRPDADHVELDPTRTSLGGHAGTVAVNKIGGKHLRFRSGYSYKTPGFEINDLGFMRRADQQSISNWLQVRHETPSRWYRRAWWNLNQWAGWNFAGDRLNFGGNVNGHVKFHNSTEMGAGLTYNAKAFDDTLTRGGPGGYTDPRKSFFAYVETDDRRLFGLEQFANGWSDAHGGSEIETESTVIIRPGSAMKISGGARWSRNLDRHQWIENVTDVRDHYVFGDLDQKTFALTLRVNYTLQPALSLQVYAEPFVSSGRYRSYSELVNGRAAYALRYAPFEYGTDADFRYASFRTTNVLRWEYRPGSALFVVWQQGREQDDELGGFRFGRDVGHIFNSPARNVFLVKLSRWFNF